MEELVIAEFTTVAELAHRIEVPAGRIVRAALHELGLLLTIDEALAFDQTKALVAQFGYAARRTEQ
jgi:hypothetical protein